MFFFFCYFFNKLSNFFFSSFLFLFLFFSKKKYYFKNITFSFHYLSLFFFYPTYNHHMRVFTTFTIVKVTVNYVTKGYVKHNEEELKIGKKMGDKLIGSILAVYMKMVSWIVLKPFWKAYNMKGLVITTILVCVCVL